MIAELDKRQKYGAHASEGPPKYGPSATRPKSNCGTRRPSLLRARVAAMNLDNFVVRPQRQLVEKYVKPEVWKQLSDDDHAELATASPACHRNRRTKTKRPSASTCWSCAPSFPSCRPSLISPAAAEDPGHRQRAGRPVRDSSDQGRDHC
jgi:hypothetical protein